MGEDVTGEGEEDWEAAGTTKERGAAGKRGAGTSV